MKQTPTLPEHWDPSPDRYDLTTDYGVHAYWSHIHRCGRAYADRIAAERSWHGPGPGPSRRRVVPIVDLELHPSLFTEKGEPEAWEIERPATADTPAQRRLPRGTQLEPVGWGGWPLEGLEVTIFRLVDGPIADRELVHAPTGGRFGAVGALVSALLMDPHEPIASDPERATALLADLARIRDEVISADPPTLPAEVLDVLHEALELDRRRLVKLIERRSGDSEDAELRELVRRAENSADPNLLPPLRWEVGAVLRCATGNTPGRYPANWTVWRALWCAALGQLAPGLSSAEATRLRNGWDRVKARAQRRRRWAVWRRVGPAS